MHEKDKMQLKGVSLGVVLTILAIVGMCVVSGHLVFIDY